MNSIPLEEGKEKMKQPAAIEEKPLGDVHRDM